MVRCARWIRIAGLGAMAVGLTACDCDSGFPELFLDDFERACGEAACDWTVEGGVARRVTTFHAAEHGLELGPGARLSLATEPSGPIGVVTAGQGQPADQLQVLVDCEPETGLLVEAEVAVGGGAVVVLEARVTAGAAHVGGGRLVLVRVPLVGAAESVEAIEGDVQVLRLVVEGPGTCIIDDLRLVGGRMFSCNG